MTLNGLLLYKDNCLPGKWALFHPELHFKSLKQPYYRLPFALKTVFDAKNDKRKPKNQISNIIFVTCLISINRQGDRNKSEKQYTKEGSNLGIAACLVFY
jgi:predicted nucleic acid binding AN1-type Zn finger protein